MQCILWHLVIWSESAIMKWIFICKLFQEMHSSASVFDLSLYAIAALADQLSAVDSLIDSMNLVYEDDDGETFEDLFKPSKIPNPHFQRLYQVRWWTIWHLKKHFFLETFYLSVSLVHLGMICIVMSPIKCFVLKYGVAGNFHVVWHIFYSGFLVISGFQEGREITSVLRSLQQHHWYLGVPRLDKLKLAWLSHHCAVLQWSWCRQRLRLQFLRRERKYLTVMEDFSSLFWVSSNPEQSHFFIHCFI